MKDCKWLHDMCGGCGQKHHREECTANLDMDSFCANCDSKGHTVWDRNCPTFIEKCKKLNATNKDSQFTLFITHNASMWEMVNSESNHTDEEGEWTRVTR